MTAVNSITINSNTLEQLKELVRINIDSCKGFEQSAETVENENLAALFRGIAVTRLAHANALSRLVDMTDADAPSDGSTLGTAHRWWLAARGALNGGDELVILIEAERGEDAIKAAYENAIDTTSGSRFQPLLLDQYAEVKRNHDRIRDLRDAMKQA